MKFTHVLPLVALGSAFVVPNEQVFNELAVENNRHAAVADDGASSKDAVLKGFKKHFDEVTSTVNEASHNAKNALDEAFAYATDAGNSVSEHVHDSAYDAKTWYASTLNDVYDVFDERDDPPHDEPPHHGPPHHGPPHRRPHHPPHHGPPNQTVYELISKSKYTTKLVKLIDEFPDLVEALNGTKANYTVFAPTDKAFEKIPEHHPKPTKEQLKALLEYHVSPDFYPAGRVLVTHTIPTLLKGDHLASEPKPQRLSVKLGLTGLHLNFYSRIIAINIFGTNGVIHGVDSLILPPPNVIKIFDLLPTEFSTLELGLGKTGLLETLNTTDHAGGTFFAPSNFAFKKLGPKINAFLFSTFGQKYLKALLEYHVVPNNTLYSDAYYKASSEEQMGVPKGYFHVDLPTMLEDRTLAVDVARYGAFISIKVNAFSRVTVQDGVAEDGVIQVVGDVLIPPKKLGPPGAQKDCEGELTVEELMDRLEPFVDAKADL